MPQVNDPFSTVVPFEVPGSIREFAEKGVTQAREAYEKFKEAAQSSNETLEAVYSSATKGASDYTSKLIDIARTNANASFDLAEKLIHVKSPSEALSLVAQGTTFGDICELVAAHVSEEDAPRVAFELLSRWITDELISNEQA